MRFVAPGDFTFDVPFIFDYNPQIHHIPGYTVERKVLDAFMVEEVRRFEEADMRTSCHVTAIERDGEGFVLDTSAGKIRCGILIDASGTSSDFSVPYIKPNPIPKKTAIAVRSYYQGVTGMHPQNYIELYFLKDILPGYFWIFPLKDGKANAGLGLRKDVVLKKKVNLSAVMERIIREHPMIAPRFENAEMLGKPAAYRLPLGNPRFRISGDRYMLTGDAGHLVDPLTGEGVGNALYSGYIAAEQAILCLKDKRFDAQFMKAYDDRIKRVLGKEMSISANMQKLLFYPELVRRIAKKADKNVHVPQLLSSMYTNMDYRKKLYNPIYLLRVLLNK
jgi:flavin-dependent dehydrogenase